MSLPRNEPSEARENRPWTIVMILPNAQYSIISQFRNRQDAEDQLLTWQ
jgi:hypothetical protein